MASFFVPGYRDVSDSHKNACLHLCCREARKMKQRLQALFLLAADYPLHCGLSVRNSERSFTVPLPFDLFVVQSADIQLLEELFGRDGLNGRATEILDVARDDVVHLGFLCTDGNQAILQIRPFL